MAITTSKCNTALIVAMTKRTYVVLHLGCIIAICLLAWVQNKCGNKLDESLKIQANAITRFENKYPTSEETPKEAALKDLFDLLKLNTEALASGYDAALSTGYLTSVYLLALSSYAIVACMRKRTPFVKAESSNLNVD